MSFVLLLYLTMRNLLREASSGSLIDKMSCGAPGNASISYFFCQYNDATSLEAATVLGSLIRQNLSVKTLSEEVEKQLEKTIADSSPDIEEFRALFEMVVAGISQPLYIFIDGLDECPKDDRDEILAVLRAISISSRSIKIFLASRDGIDKEVHQAFKSSYLRQTMSCSEAHDDIKSYVKDVIKERLEQGELAVSDLALCTDIEDSLIKGACGMSVHFANYQSSEHALETDMGV